MVMLYLPSTAANTFSQQLWYQHVSLTGYVKYGQSEIVFFFAVCLWEGEPYNKRDINWKL